MKKLEIFLFGMYAIGLTFKLMKLPMHTVFILTTLLILVVYYTICLVKKTNEEHKILTGFVTVVWLFELLSVLKHFPFADIVLIIACLSSIALIFTLYKRRKLTYSTNVIVLSIIILISVILIYSPAHKIYYLTNIKFNYEIKADYRSWDKYSWFLYVAGKEEDALLANVNAQKAIEINLANHNEGHRNKNEYLSIIKEHELAIKKGNWLKYYW